MAEHPLLVFPRPSQIDRAKRAGGGKKVSIPSASDQGGRLSPQFQRLQSVLTQHSLRIQDNSYGIQPEQVLVLETIGPIERFISAVQKLGLEWLSEIEIDDIEPGDGFEYEDNDEKLLNGRLFLVMTDQEALRQLQSLFNSWKETPDAKFARGLAPIRQAFIHLKSIRPWDAEDRIRDTGLAEDWRLRLEHGQTTVPFEAEFWFRQSPERRTQTREYVTNIVEGLGGTIQSECLIEEIAYHAVLGRIPSAHVDAILQLDEVNLVRCGDIMQLRPLGQCVIGEPPDLSKTEEFSEVPEEDLSGRTPVIALLDGLPLAGHQLLDGRLIIDDPDGYESDYQANERIHGTAMASLICHGDLSQPSPGHGRPVYVRPILRPNRSFPGRAEESIPENVLPIDLIHRAVRRMFVGDGSELPVAEDIRVINLSVCDRYRPFDRSISPWARLLDWLSWEYKVLFIVSAGNHLSPIELSIPRGDFNGLGQTEIEKLVVQSIASDTRHRRLLSPAETLNGLTIGAEHTDLSYSLTPVNLIDPFAGNGRPNIVSAHGPGYRRSIKPDILMPGGRQLLSERLGNTHPNAELTLNTSEREPGQKVASPGPGNDLIRTIYTSGTSNATAIATHWSGRLFQAIEEIRESGTDLNSDYDVILLKTMLVHGADWNLVRPVFEAALRNSENSRKFRDYVSRFFGYGPTRVENVVNCTDQRVTILGIGELRDGLAHEFYLPLPPSLSAITEKRRLTITLSWLTPVHPRNQKYRYAQLWFDPKNNLAPNRVNADDKAVQRGTVQHEVLEGSNAVDFQDGDVIAIKVNCRADAGPFDHAIKYALAVSLEVSEGVEIPIYQEVRERLQVPIAI